MTTVFIVICAILAIALAGALVWGFMSGKNAETRGFEKGIEHNRQESERKLAAAEKAAQAKAREAEARMQDAELKLREAGSMMENVGKEAEARKKEALVEAKDEIYKLRQDAEKEIRDRRNEISKQEKRIHQKEETLDKKIDTLEKKEETLQGRLTEIDALKAEAEQIRQRQLDELERISGLTREQAKEYILHTLEEDLVHDKAVKVAAYEQQIKEDCEEKARSYISLAVAKCAADQVSEAAVSVVALPSDEMKGRIIGREGRNIRTLETLTGVDLIIDDTPEAITLSCFDQVRREIARIALERLIADGRIHPSRIEEMVEKAKREVEHKIKQEGERAVLETNVHGINHELIKLLGRLKFRTSYRQNVLTHSIEVAQLCGVLAAELGVDVNLAKRAGLLHDALPY